MSVQRRAVSAALVALAATAVAGCGNLGMPHPVTAQGTESRDLWRIFVDLACVTVEAIPYSRLALARLVDTVRSYK